MLSFPLLAVSHSVGLLLCSPRIYACLLPEANHSGGWLQGPDRCVLGDSREVSHCAAWQAQHGGLGSIAPNQVCHLAELDKGTTEAALSKKILADSMHIWLSWLPTPGTAMYAQS